ncbi:TetR/AcrR family transcriptional regulator [Micromonospora profundi]|uniref:TetR/AcrR family transcriptional regulator C-terminal domain-containing protein n=1 Tax=Micromonospora profundi TaxID=1420889 RepID=A0AAJ6HNC4_9ACTN|nr:TetR/AcrR family transcriptional regulator C-terminal domain-containing protein [Micromonospora profundi]WLS43806.1 TetR/AcrR family transcriptional regulator C-terminal domain-containing protein [Micromonospora profundi]
MSRTEGGPAAGDRRVRRTHAALRSALIRLAEDRELSQISVADVAGQAGVSRSTFYDHYRDVHELAEAACTGMIDELVDVMTALGGDPETGDPLGSLQTFFAALAEHASLYRSLLGPQGSARVIDHIRRRMAAAALQRSTGKSTATPDDPHNVPAAFVAGAIVGVAADWLQRDCAHTPSEMAKLTWPILSVCHFDAHPSAPRPRP